MAKARTRDSTQALDKLTHIVDGERRIISDPPLVQPVEELAGAMGGEQILDWLRAALRKYRSTLQSDRRHLLEDFHIVHAARKVVGVGSVGTRAWILLMLGRDDADPLFLQAKEAQPSVLEDFVGPTRHVSNGERVVHGQHVMAAASDIFLGWAHCRRTRRRDPRLLRAPAPRLERLRRHREPGSRDDGLLRPYLRFEPGPRPRPLRRPHRDRRLPRRERLRSTRRSPSSPRPTPTRTNATTTPSSKPRRTAASPPNTDCDPRLARGARRTQEGEGTQVNQPVTQPASAASSAVRLVASRRQTRIARDGVRRLQRPAPGVAAALLRAAGDLLPGVGRRRRRDDGPGVPEHDQPHRRGHGSGADGARGHPLHGQGVGRPPQPGGERRVRAARRLSVAGAYPGTSWCSSAVQRSRHGSCRQSCTCRPRSARTIPPPASRGINAFWMELILTFGLVSVILGTASGAQNLGVIGAIGVGGYIALAGLWGSPISGASMNPSRTFGPDLVSADFTSYWVYVAGPLAGRGRRGRHRVRPSRSWRRPRRFRRCPRSAVHRSRRSEQRLNNCLQGCRSRRSSRTSGTARPLSRSTCTGT